MTTKIKTLESAAKDFPSYTGARMDAAVANLLKQARAYDGIEVHYPDWPEAAEAAKRHPHLLLLGEARGPGGEWRRLYYTGQPE